jgi:hypothetical protein
MRVREAKDFLVQETAEQASLEGVPLSALEKRMMYFTESGEVPEDPIKLNEEFEAEYDTAKYEAKIARLMRHAYARLRTKNDETARHGTRQSNACGMETTICWSCGGRPLARSGPPPIF